MVSCHVHPAHLIKINAFAAERGEAAVATDGSQQQQQQCKQEQFVVESSVNLRKRVLHVFVCA